MESGKHSDKAILDVLSKAIDEHWPGTVAQLAESAGCSTSHISNIRAGRVSLTNKWGKPSKTGLKICRALGIDDRYLYEDLKIVWRAWGSPKLTPHDMLERLLKSNSEKLTAHLIKTLYEETFGKIENDQ